MPMGKEVTVADMAVADMAVVKEEPSFWLVEVVTEVVVMEVVVGEDGV